MSYGFNINQRENMLYVADTLSVITIFTVILVPFIIIVGYHWKEKRDKESFNKNDR